MIVALFLQFFSPKEEYGLQFQYFCFCKKISWKDQNLLTSTFCLQSDVQHDISHCY